MATTTGSQTSTPRGPGEPQDTTRGGRLRAIAWIVGPTLAVLLAFVVLWATVLRDPAPEPVPADAAQPEQPAEEPPADGAPVDDQAAPAAPPLTPEQEAAADAEARYREYDAVYSQHVADPPDRFYPDGLPIDTVSAGLLRAGTVTAWNDVALQDQALQASVGDTTLAALEVTDVNLFDEPRTVDDREAVEGLATVDVCRDVSQTTPVNAAGEPVESQGADYVLFRVEMSLQPNPGNAEDPETVQWYAVNGRTLWYSDESDLPSDELVAACPGAVLDREGADA